MKRTISAYQICFLALFVVLNFVGGQLALMLRLPIYLDSIGTFLTGALLGPWFGMVPSLLNGVIMGMTVDIYSLYFAPTGMIIGFMSGLVFRWWKKNQAGPAQMIRIFAAALLISLPGTVASALTCGVLFGGVTSSGSTILVQLLSKTPLGLTGSIIAVQIVTDYLDRVISLFVVLAFLKVLPANFKAKLKGDA